jgi:cytidylate kinase
VVDFMSAAPGVEVVDSTELDFEGSVTALLAVVARMQEVQNAR